MRKWKPPDVIAIVIVGTCAGLLSTGRDHIISIVLLVVTVGYYGIDLTGILDNFRKKGGK